MNDEVRKLADSIGALAEIMGIFYKNLLKQGFRAKEALELTKTYLMVIYDNHGF